MTIYSIVTMVPLHLLSPCSCPRYVPKFSCYKNDPSAPILARTTSFISRYRCHITIGIPRQCDACSIQTVSSSWMTVKETPIVAINVRRNRLLYRLAQSRNYHLVCATANTRSAAESGDHTIAPSVSTIHSDSISPSHNVKRPAVYEASSTLATQHNLPPQTRLQQMAPVDQAFLLLGFIACLTAGVMTMVLMTAIPTLNAMRRAAVAMEKLAEVAREELPSTMAAIRLSGMEISDLTLELSDLSQEISDDLKSSVKATKAAEDGIRRVGVFAAAQTMSMMQKRPIVPVEALNPAMSNAAQKTREVLDVTQKIVVTLISHPKLAGWLGQVLAKKEEKEVTEGVPEIKSKIENIEPTIIPKVEDIISSDKKGSETPNIAPAEE